MPLMWGADSARRQLSNSTVLLVHLLWVLGIWMSREKWREGERNG